MVADDPIGAVDSVRVVDQVLKHTGDGRAARSLGWASLGVGLAAAAVPDSICRLAGYAGSDTAKVTVRTMGVRDLGLAAGLLTAGRVGRWTWGRAAADVSDLAVMARAFAGGWGEPRRRRAIGIAAALTVADLVTSVRAARAAVARGRAWRARAAVTVNRPAHEVYEFWRDVENLPHFMSHLQQVRVTGEGRSHWTARGPAGRPVRWEAQIVEERPHELISWRSVAGSMVPNAGSVRFIPAAGRRGTEVRVELAYAPPAGPLGRAVAMLFGEDPQRQVQDDLRRFKQVMETGEVVRSDASPGGADLRQQVFQRPARPLETTVVD